MSELIIKIKSWYSNLRAVKVSFEKKGIKPKNDWSMILLGTIIVVTSLALISTYFYTEVNNGTYFKSENQEEIKEVKINKNLLNKIVEDTKNREKNLIEIKNGKIIPSNPSL